MTPNPNYNADMDQWRRPPPAYEPERLYVIPSAHESEEPKIIQPDPWRPLPAYPVSTAESVLPQPMYQYPSRFRQFIGGLLMVTANDVIHEADQARADNHHVSAFSKGIIAYLIASQAEKQIRKGEGGWQ